MTEMIYRDRTRYHGALMYIDEIYTGYFNLGGRYECVKLNTDKPVMWLGAHTFLFEGSRYDIRQIEYREYIPGIDLQLNVIWNSLAKTSTPDYFDPFRFFHLVG